MRNSSSKLHCGASPPASAHRIPLCASLSHDEEPELADLIANGDRDARNRVVQANLRLVMKIARDFQGQGLSLDDLIGEGNLGLIWAAENFGSRFGTRVSTYAAYWIKESIRCTLINTTRTIRFPAHMIGLLTTWRRAERALAREQGMAPSFEAVAAVLRLSQTEKMRVAHARGAVRFTQEGTDALVTAWHASAERSNRSQACDATLELDDELHIVLESIQRLEARERTVLELR